MEHTITVTTVQRTKAASNHHIQPSTQDKIGSPVVSQASRDYSPPPSNIPETPIPLCKLELQSLPVNVRTIANPAPLGLCAFALTSFLSNCVALNVGGMKVAGVSMSLALSYGGIAQVLAGMWYVLSCFVCCLVLIRVGKWRLGILLVRRPFVLSVPIGYHFL